jgi:hypothetical protein
MSIGPDQHGGRGADRAKCRKFPQAAVLGVDQLDPIRPRSDVEAAWLTEVEQHRPSFVSIATSRHCLWSQAGLTLDAKNLLYKVSL